MSAILDLPGTVRHLRGELGLTVDEAARRITGAGGSYLDEAIAALSDVEGGGDGADWLDADYWLAGLFGLWMFGPGGWTREDGGYRHIDGARIGGNGTGSWLSWPGPSRKDRPFTQERLDIRGPVHRRDVLRLMVRAEAIRRASP